MNMEQLTKSQLVLLALMVSFVSSVATGIVTVTLMEQAPPAVTQTVNRIVERTVEKVAPAGEVAAASAVIETHVIREGDLVADAVATIEPSVVRLYTPGQDEAGNAIRVYAGIAIVVNSSGLLLADAGTPDAPLTGVRSDGIEVPLSVARRIEGAKMITLQGPTTREVQNDSGATETQAVEWNPATFKNELSLLGKTAVVISGGEATKIAVGVITGSESSNPERQTLETDIPLERYGAGSPLLNIDGEVIGMATRETRNAKLGFLASPSILLYSEEHAGEESPQ